MNTFYEEPMDAILTLYVTDAQLAKRFTVARQTIWRWATDSDFPRPIKLSGGCTRWFLPSVEAWEKGRAARKPRPT